MTRDSTKVFRPSGRFSFSALFALTGGLLQIPVRFLDRDAPRGFRANAARLRGNALCDETEDPDEDDVQEEAEPERKKQNGYERHGWPDVEKQALDRVEIGIIRKLVESKDPKYWSLFCRVEVNGEEKKDVGAELGITPQRVGQLAAKVREIAVKYRRENPD